MTHDPAARIEELQRELDELRAQLVEPTLAPGASTTHTTETAGSTETTGSTGTVEVVGSRRGLLRMAAGAAAGGAVAVVATSSGKVAANDGDPVEVGGVTTQGNGGRTATVVEYVNSDPPQVLGQPFGTFDPANVLLVRDEPGGFLVGPENASSYPAAVAGYANDVLANGLYGYSATGNHGVVAWGAGDSIGLLARGGRANAKMYLDGDPAPDRGDPHERGEVIADSGGDLWYCTADGSPGTWVRLNQAFVPIDPVRSFDSRIGAYAENGLLAPNESKTISVADSHDGVGTIIMADAVPDGATAIAYNVTITGTTGPNFVSVTPGDAAGYTTSTINWSGPDQSLANGGIVKLDDMRQITLFGGDQTGSTHVIVDVTGYYI